MSNFRDIDQALLSDFALPRISEDAGKEDRGRLIVIAGSRELTGAALLAGEAALRAGAGKLQIATAASVSTALAIAVPEARVVGYPEMKDGCIADDGIEPLISLAKAVQAVAIGCGMIPGLALERLISRLLAGDIDIPVVLDAAALDCLGPLEQAVHRRGGGTVLLPHAGEMAQLLDRTREQIEADPAGAAVEAARRFHAVALVKGRFSFISAPDGSLFRLEGGGVGLATSGSGDTLSGIVGGLCARGADPLSATLWGTWLHAQAGRLLTEKIGRVGFLAREIPDLIPALLPD